VAVRIAGIRGSLAQGEHWLAHNSQANVVPYMSYAATAQDETEDRYYTQVEAGDVRLFTLDQLDAAFNAGLIHENTYVCLEGESTWSTLAEVAGLGEEEPVSAPIPVAAPVPHAYAAPAPVQRAPQPFTPSIVPSSGPYGVASSVHVAPSIAPVVNDLGFDDDEAMFARPKRRAGKILAGLAVVALAGLGFAVVQSGGIRLPKLASGTEQASAATLSVPKASEVKATPAPEAPAPVAETPKPEAPQAEPAKSETDGADSSAKKTDDRFSEEMKAALLNKDKTQAASQKTKKSARAVATKARAGKPAKNSGGAFKSGGSAYDPLNGKL
jgi:hypothetical protein